MDREIFVGDSAVGSDEAVRIDEASLSVLVHAWVLALEPHLSALAAITLAAEPNTHEVSPRENAHAVAAAAMAIFLIESKEARLHAIGSRWSVAPELEEQLTELRVLRNSLVHDHIWEVLLRRSNDDWARPGELQGAEARYGLVDRPQYLKASVDRGTMRTRVLDLHLVPTEVRRWDVARLWPVVVEALDELNKHDAANMQSPADLRIKIGDQLVPLRLAVKLLV